MQRSLELMQAALRVLEAFTEHKQPKRDDVQQLTRLYGHKPDGVGYDEWACEAIQQALKHRASVRGAANN